MALNIGNYNSIGNVSSRKINLSNRPTFGASVKIPDYLYHFTNSKTLEKILNSGELRPSTLELASRDGCNGVYMLDKTNFLSQWFSRFPKGSANMSFGDALMPKVFIGNAFENSSQVAGDVGLLSVIKIPTANLDMSKLRFRDYEKIFNEQNLAKRLKPSLHAQKGLPIAELEKYPDAVIEFVYQDTIPKSAFDSSKIISKDKFYEIAKESEGLDSNKKIAMDLLA